MVYLRNKIIGFIYRNVLRPVFFLQDPEEVHDRMVRFGNVLGRSRFAQNLLGLFFGYQNIKLEQTVAGMHFKNPIGLAAGFDKEALLPEVLPYVGFGFEEAGSVTALPFEGNERPWMWRIPEAKTLRINYGLKNSGAENIYNRLLKKKLGLVLGISLAKTNSPKTAELNAGIEDYLQSYKIFQNVGDYFTINISCPNTCEEKPIFAEPENLDLLLKAIFALPKTKPVFIKLSPDLPDGQLMGILKLADAYPIDGFVCSNLTKVNKFNHLGKGGFSGKAVEDLSNILISKVYKYYEGRKIIIGCGGVFSAKDAYKKIKLGASLIQLITGMIYEGPQLIGEINYGLVELLTQDGYQNISQAVGTNI